MNILEQIREKQLEHLRMNRSVTKLYLGIEEWSLFRIAVRPWSPVREYPIPDSRGEWLRYDGMEVVLVKRISYLEVG